MALLGFGPEAVSPQGHLERGFAQSTHHRAGWSPTSGVPVGEAASEAADRCARPSAAWPAGAVAESRTTGADPAEAIARISWDRRTALLRSHGHRLGREDLEDCFSQATPELVVRARTRARAFVSDEHVANALEQRFLSRIADRRRALTGRSPMEAALQTAVRQPVAGTGTMSRPAPRSPTAGVRSPSGCWLATTSGA